MFLSRIAKGQGPRRVMDTPDPREEFSTIRSVKKVKRKFPQLKKIESQIELKPRKKMRYLDSEGNYIGKEE